MRKLFFLFFLILAALAEPKLPEISPKDVRKKMDEILKAHVNYKKLTPELVKRALNNFLEELDPTKTYFLASDISEWTQPSDALLQETLENFKRSNFQTFIKMHETMTKAIARRNLLEKEIEQKELPQKVDPEEFKDLAWAENEEGLLDRLLRLKSLQVGSIVASDGIETKEEFLQRIQKRRLNYENEILADGNAEEMQKWILAHILKASSCALDAHTNYFTPSEASQFMIQVQQRLFGIGAQLRDSLHGFTIVRMLEGGPAALSNKLKINDRIVSVNQTPVIGMDIVEAVELIRGEKGTKVNLTVLRDSPETKQSERLDIELVRGEVVIEEGRLETHTLPFADGVIAHLKLFSFYQDPNTSSAADIAKALEQIKKEHPLKGVILDLRSNAGGLLPQAVAVTGLFITKGIVVSIKDSSGKIQHLRELDGRVLWDGPLFVLTNRASASAAEIVAQTLQDYGRGIVIGDEHTFGKGTFQTFTLDAGNNGKVSPQGEFKVTRGKYYTVSGKSPQLKGVPADIVVPGLLSALDIGEEFSKYPLENDEIGEHFEDDLSDIPFLHRESLSRLYKRDIQPRLTTYQPFLSLLKKNSEQRIKANKQYQSFLQEAAKKNFDSESVESFSRTDMQMQECLDIMKDLLFIMQMNEKPFE